MNVFERLNLETLGGSRNRDLQTFDRAKSPDIAAEVAHRNAKPIGERCPYVLRGVGRWDTLVHCLGIPVTRGQISGAVTKVRIRIQGFFRDSLAGVPLLSEHHLLSGRVLHRGCHT
jgi:hypothetical protein